MNNLLCRVATVVVALLLSLASAEAQEKSRDARDFELGRATEILANIMREFETGYVDEVSADRLLESAAMGLVEATDPYSEYLSEESMRSFEVMTTGRYGGVGSLIRKKGDYVIFAQPYKDSPSDDAGVRIGDKILAIDGVSMRGLDVAEISKRLKGDPETQVSVVVERNLDGVVDTLSIVRRRISIPSVPYAGFLRDGVGYILHNDFKESSYDEVRRALESLMAQDTLRGLVLDYRSNGGGVMQAAVDIASLFLPRGERIVSIMGRDSSSLRHFDTRHAPLAEDIPVVVLVNGSSASASEILAGALQDNDRAVVMGQRTYGKGLVQGTRHMGYTSDLKYTTAKYYIPSGRCIQALNYAERGSDGKVNSVPDSLIRQYSTRNGRRVYDGGGIVPDVKMEPRYVSRFALTLYALGFMEDWADEYMRKHHARSIDVRTFTITDEEYDDFKRFIAERDVPYESETRLALKSLERAMENDLYDERMGEALENLRSLLSDDKMSNMETYRREIVDMLNYELLLRYAYSQGAMEHAAVTDDEVERAVVLLLDDEQYRRILREQHLDMH